MQNFVQICKTFLSTNLQDAFIHALFTVLQRTGHSWKVRLMHKHIVSTIRSSVITAGGTAFAKTVFINGQSPNRDVLSKIINWRRISTHKQGRHERSARVATLLLIVNWRSILFPRKSWRPLVPLFHVSFVHLEYSLITCVKLYLLSFSLSLSCTPSWFVFFFFFFVVSNMLDRLVVQHPTCPHVSSKPVFHL